MLNRTEGSRGSLRIVLMFLIKLSDIFAGLQISSIHENKPSSHISAPQTFGTRTLSYVESKRFIFCVQTNRAMVFWRYRRPQQQHAKVTVPPPKQRTHTRTARTTTRMPIDGHDKR